MIKKIGLVELYAHSEVLYHFIELYLSQNHEVQIFTNDFIYEDAYKKLKESPKVQWFTRTERESRPVFIEKNLHHINSCEQIIFITLISDYQFFAKLFLNTFSTLIIHNATSYLRPYRGIRLVFSKTIIMDILRLAKFFIKREAYWKQQMLANFDEICFPTATIQQYVETQKWTKKYNVGKVMSFAINKKNEKFTKISKFSKCDDKTTITFTIPGTIDKNARNYEMIYRIFRAILSQTQRQIHLVLLGRPKSNYGLKIIRLFQSLARETCQVTHFKNSVPQYEFDEWMKQTDVLILPLRQHLKLGLYREQYGYTNVSGGVNDAIKFAIPTLLPSFYPIEKDMNILLEHFYTERDLEKKIKKIIQ